MDPIAGESRHRRAIPIQNDQTPGLRGRGRAIRCGQTSNDHESGPQGNQGSGQPHASGARPVQGAGIQGRKKCYISVSTDLIDCNSSPLKVGGVIEVTDQYASLFEFADRGWHDGYTVGVDVAVGRNRGRDRFDAVQVLGERTLVVVGTRGECYKSYDS